MCTNTAAGEGVFQITDTNEPANPVRVCRTRRRGSKKDRMGWASDCRALRASATEPHRVNLNQEWRMTGTLRQTNDPGEPRGRWTAATSRGGKVGFSAARRQLVVMGLLWLGLGSPSPAATLTVSTTADSGNGSLRQALEDANASPGLDTITFRINSGGPGVKTIRPRLPLPDIVSPVVIDGWSQGGTTYTGPPLIELTGESNLVNATGLHFLSGGNTVQGLIINRFGFHGIALVTNGFNVIQGNYIGTDSSGTLARPNTNAGIVIVNSPNNTIGGLTPAARNIISGNRRGGVELLSSGAYSNRIQGNYIGLDPTGSQAVPNQGPGVSVNALGGTTDDYATDNVIGGSVAAARNLISGQNGPGILIFAVEAGLAVGPTRNVVAGNYIGTDKDGTRAIPNQGPGIWIMNATRNTIGGDTENERNLISGNVTDGILLEQARSNIVRANFIGSAASGLAAVGNLAGVTLDECSNNTIGGEGEERNLISGNSVDGIEIIRGRDNRILGNFIGLGRDGTTLVPNERHGVSIFQSTNNSVGSEAGISSRIAGNGAHGVFLIQGISNLVQGNIIATNGQDGVQISGGERNRLHRNISGGVVFVGGTLLLGNGRYGVAVLDSSNNVIGRVGTDLNNNIYGNRSHGVFLGRGPLGFGASSNLVQANNIGTIGLGNGGHGVFVQGSGNLIGGFEVEEGNKIEFNGTNMNQRGHGVVIESGTNNAILANLFQGNAGRAIDLGNDSFTVNDIQDVDEGPNDRQNYPVVTRVAFHRSAGVQVITWNLNSRPLQSYYLEFFGNPEPDRSGFGEGAKRLGSLHVFTDEKGMVEVPVQFPLTEQYISATATDVTERNTSEFSPVDTDGDAIADAWEMSGIDFNEDGRVDLLLADANPMAKDVYVEIDAMLGRAPDMSNLYQVVTGQSATAADPVTSPDGLLVSLSLDLTDKDDGFFHAPAEKVQNPDGSQGVFLHLERDETYLPPAGWGALNYTFFDVLKENFYGTVAERANPNALAAKRLIYRYCIFADSAPGVDGMARALGASDFFVSLREESSEPTSDRVKGVFMHELGHSLGLRHGGGDNVNFKPNYHSVMNYLWSRPGGRCRPWRLDYSREAFATLDETDLDENVGLGASDAHAGHMVMVGPYVIGPVPVRVQVVPEVGPLDWDEDGTPGEIHVPRNISFLSGILDSPMDVLQPHEDWSKLRYYFLDNRFTNGQFSGEFTNDLDPAVLDALEKLGTGPGHLQFSASRYTVSETGAVARISIRRVFEAAANVSVTFSMSGGTATAGTDYVATNGVISFSGTESEKIITIPILDDGAAETPETVQMTLSNPTGGATLGDRVQATLVILDNDPPGTFTVSNTNNSGAGSLRQALLDANAAPDKGIIRFNIPGSSGLTISPGSALPAITNTLTLDGTTQPGFAGVPLIELNGAGAGAGSDALRINAPRCVVRGLVINRFAGHGVALLAGDGSQVEGCYIGLNRAGVVDQGNSLHGIHIQTAGNLIGGSTPAARNVISGNNLSGIQISGLNATNNRVLGNLIGLGLDGSDQGNSAAGLTVSSSGNFIGGTAAVHRNVISGNDQDGVAILGGADNRVLGNYIGTDAAGAVARGNGQHGIRVSLTSVVVIGGSRSGSGNLISGNAQRGIELSQVTGGVVLGNRIGTDAGGSNAVPNQAGGIALSFALNNQIGWPAGALTEDGLPYPANTIAFNNGPGIALRDTACVNNVLRGNAIFSNTQPGIGLFPGATVNDPNDTDTGANTLQNFPVLTRASNSAAGTVIAGSLPSTPNRTFTIDFYASAVPHPSGGGEGQSWIGATRVTTGISGNAAFNVTTPAIFLAGRHLTATATDAAGNTSELSPPFSAAVTTPGRTFLVVNTNDSGAGSLRQAILDANAYASVGDTIAFDIPGAEVHTIRPLTPLPRIQDAVVIDGYTQPGATPNSALVGHNGSLRIELDGSLAGAAHGLRVEAENCIIRGLVINRFAAGADVFNLPGGLMISGGGGHRIEGNFIGTDATGALDRGNAFRGVVIYQSSNNVIGGSAPAARNVISGNDISAGIVSGEGVLLYGDSVAHYSGNRIEGNLIGTAANGTSPLGNSGCAVRIGQPVTNTTIGGTAPGAGNVIAFNGAGAQPPDACGIGDPLNFGARSTAILGNSIHSNSGPGIGGDQLNAPGGRGNFPLLSSAMSSNGVIAIQGRLHSVSNAPHRIELFANHTIEPGGHGEGRVFLGATNVATDANGYVAFTAVLAAAVTNGSFITATATDDRNNTSEFSPRLAAGDVLTNVIVVNSANDVDDGYANGVHTSLREAILAANNHLGADTIRFAIGAGARTLVFSNALPPLLDAGTTLDGATQPGFAGQPLIFLDGLLSTPTGLRLLSPSNTIRGFAISRFGFGLYADGSQASPFGGFNVIEGNYLGNDGGTGGTAAQDFGVYLAFGCPSNRIGGATAAARNIISGNRRAGIYAFDSAGNSIVGNFVGTDRTGTNAVGNGIGNALGGIYLQRCRGTMVGGAAGGLGNLISGNASIFNIQLFLWDDCTDSLVQGNYIGTDATGRTNLGASLVAIDVSGSGRVLIRSNLLCGGGLVSFETYGSVNLASPSNRLEGNFIGTDVTGTRAFGLPAGVVISVGGNGNRIGGTNPASRNLISGGGYGIRIKGTSNMVQGNFIGTQVDGVSPLGNFFDGVLVQNSFNQIGGPGPGEGNVIAFNVGAGIAMTAGTNNALLGNAIYGNTNLGIDLAADGVTTNDLGDLDLGPNRLQNFPLLTTARNVGPATLIRGTLNSLGGSSFRLEFFASSNCHASGSGQGRVFLSATTLPTDASGTATFSFTHPAPVPVGLFITATATDSNNNTSEFSPCVPVINDTNYVALAIAGSGASYVISWATNAPGFRLERSTNLAPPVVWQVISNGITTNGMFRTLALTNDPGLPTRFFRLVR